MATDAGPIYCAEQIIVPPNLADVLKNYTKEVLRKQPANLLEFSAAYFNDLSNAAKGISSVTPPTAAQLAGAWAALTPKATASYSELTAACEVAGISKATVSGVFQASCVATSGPIDVAQALLLLLTLGRASFQAVVQGIFEVFGTNVSVPLFTQLLAFVGTKDVDNAGREVQDEVTAALEGKETVSYGELAACPKLWSKLG